MITSETFDSFVFMVARVRFAGPTNTRGSRYIASIRRDNEHTYRVTHSYDGALSPSKNASAAAQKCLRKALADNPYHDGTISYVAIPGDLSANSYAFTFVPHYFFD